MFSYPVFTLRYILLPADVLFVADIRIRSRASFLIVFAGDDFETVCHTICIDNVVVAYYKTLSFLFCLTRNMDSFFTHFSAF